jgi:hypothetical protein
LGWVDLCGGTGEGGVGYFVGSGEC